MFATKKLAEKKYDINKKGHLANVIDAKFIHGMIVQNFTHLNTWSTRVFMKVRGQRDIRQNYCVLLRMMYVLLMSTK